MILAFEKNSELKRQRDFYISSLTNELQIPAIAQIRILELLLNGEFGILNDEQRNILNLTLESCKKMQEMISSVIQSYRYDNNEVSLAFEKCSLFELLDSSSSKYSKIFENIKIYTEDCFIKADRSELLKAFNILADFTAANSSGGTIFKVEKSGESILISAEYSGCPEFNKVGVSSSLQLAKQIFAAHGGNIILNNNMCVVILPILKECNELAC